jgi:uncharacterized membrane protein YhaH (DUF805 family)
MDYAWFLFGFEGRINRAKCWLAVLIVICWMLFFALLAIAIANIFGVPIKSLHFGTDDIFGILDPASYRFMSSTEFARLFFHVVTTPLFLWVYVATSIKRLHDRDRSGWWMLPFFVIPGLYRHFEDRLGDSTAVGLLGLAVYVFYLWGFIEIYLRKGTKGTNRFGPDPLAPVDRRPGWDQQRELEFVPQRAGPSPGPHVNRGA